MKKTTCKKRRLQKPEPDGDSHSNGPRAKSIRTVNGFDCSTNEPYPAYSSPTSDECLSVRDDLLNLHGFPREFVIYRKERERLSECCSVVDGSGGELAENVKSESVLDGLVRTVLSQNTTEANSEKAFASLKSAFATWEDVLSAESKCIEDAIRCGGLAPTKASCIKNILSSLSKRRGKLCLEYLHNLSIDEVKAELSTFKGIGPKTVACVLMFNLQKDDFPVDTHVFEIAKFIGWVPDEADRNKTYLHLNQRIPNHLKFDLNCLLYTHGKLCSKCSKRTGGGRQRKVSENQSCPLLKYSKNL
ncbi:putative DNA glycosylase At3g47830 [Cucurbita maxima]|uniref:DNA glycosylase At3g47830 n=1 Tax=Cucurbita maxima TaxID=3661 RepID=A0A6J1JWG0_CUCMA|nr:putative DNA glycosylase At3g47830 [Cucurbita maxima]